jgi:hypothetical protein
MKMKSGIWWLSRARVGCILRHRPLLLVDQWGLNDRFSLGYLKQLRKNLPEWSYQVVDAFGVRFWFFRQMKASHDERGTGFLDRQFTWSGFNFSSWIFANILLNWIAIFRCNFDRKDLTFKENLFEYWNLKLVFGLLNCDCQPKQP